MPRIDPLQLLKCLSVLLGPNGGILSQDEVPRLVNLMTKFSKKLVSKCVYVLILKNTEDSLVDLFMTEGGWTLVQTWLQDAMHVSNYDLVTEILELLLVTPADVERLKLNNIPKLVKSLSRCMEQPGVQKLSSDLVQHWLVIVKNSNGDGTPSKTGDQTDLGVLPAAESTTNKAVVVPTSTPPVTQSSYYKISVRDGKQVIKKMSLVKTEEAETMEVVQEAASEPIKEKSPISSPAKPIKAKSSSSSSNSSSRSSSSSRDKDRKKSSSSSKSRSSSSSTKSSSRDKDRDKDRHKTNGSKSSSKSSSSSKPKEEQSDKDKDTLDKIKPQSIEKLGRIPKKTSSEPPKKKPTMSIEVRKSSEDRPKTVKVFNGKMRSTGLEEEVKPPPPRPVKKTPTKAPGTLPVKRTSPSRDTSTNPPEKKLKVDPADRPGAIKLIPPKPKPMLQESDIFMDALTASATIKKDPKKRKRRASVNKDTPSSPTTPTGDAPPGGGSPLGLKNIAPINFYQDTLTDKDEEAGDNKSDNPASPGKAGEEDETPASPGGKSPVIEDPRPVGPDGLRGVLVHVKKKGPKRSITWKSDADLVQVRYFELDETERVNVTKTFIDMAKMDISGEREALQMSRKLTNEDLMEPQTHWKFPYLIDVPDALTVVPGSKSLEKDIQFAREISVLQTFYFDKRKIPDTPEEPLPENHQMVDPIIIPLEDAESQEIDMRNTPWPEPKGSPPNLDQPQMPMFNGPPINFNQMPPPPNFPPRFQPPPSFVPPMMNGPPMLVPPPDINNFGMPPMQMPHPHDNGPFMNQFQPPMGGNMFQPKFNNNMNRPPMMNNMNMNNMNMNNMNMNNQRGGFNNNRGNNRNNQGWMRMKGGPNGPPPGQWNNRNNNQRGCPMPGMAGNNGGGRLCKNIKNHGFCRNRDNCQFVHP